MKWEVLPLFVFLFFNLGIGQDVSEIKLDQLGEILHIVKDLQKKMEAMSESIIALEELQQSVSSKQDIVLQNTESTVEELSLHSDLLGKSCTQDQLADHLESLSTDALGLGQWSPQQGSTQLDHVLQAFTDIFKGDSPLPPTPDECDEGSHKCSPNAHCEDAFVGYHCICNEGYQGDGFFCKDVDECSLSNDCHSQASCNNTDGGFECKCLDGYTGDGYSCQEVPSRVPASIHCRSPSKYMMGIGCVIPVREAMNFDDAQNNCRRKGARLLEGVDTTGGMLQLQVLFKDYFRGRRENAAWIGLRNSSWVESGGPLFDPKNPVWHEGEPNGGSQECARVCFSCNPPDLYDWYCSDKRFSYCQKV